MTPKEGQISLVAKDSKREKVSLINIKLKIQNIFIRKLNMSSRHKWPHSISTIRLMAHFRIGHDVTKYNLETRAFKVRILNLH